MKLLKTEDQADLKQLLESLLEEPHDVETRARLNYWALEMKPKRVRKPGVVTANEKEENV